MALGSHTRGGSAETLASERPNRLLGNSVRGTTVYAAAVAVSQPFNTGLEVNVARRPSERPLG